jgi:hypothetical protein
MVWAGRAWAGMPSAAARPRPAERSVQAFGRFPRCCRLRGLLLCLAQLTDRPRQPDEARRQVKRGRRGAGLATACHRQQPGGGAEPVSLGSPGRDLPVGGPCGPVERVGGPAQCRITDRPGGGVECGGRRPGRIGGRGWVSPGAAPDLRRRRLSLPRRVPVNASRSGAVNRNGPGRDPGAAGWRFHWRRNWAASGRTPGALPRTTGARRPGRRARGARPRSR